MKQPYTKPIIQKQATMTFPTDTIEAAAGGLVCHQCSSCHGCR